MSYLINNQQKVNEIIFANRNKTYGAYAIRAAYGNTVFKSLALMMFGFGSIMAAAYYMVNRPATQSDLGGQVPMNDSTYTVIYNVTPPEPVKPVAQTPPPSGGGQAGLGTVISSTASVDTGTTTEVGTSVTTNTNTSDGPPTTSTIASIPVNTIVVEPDAVVTIPDSAPEFEGGLKALYNFLGSRLRYPGPAHEAGKEGTVYVKFVVDQKGKVCNLKLLNNLGYGLDEEAMRVVSMIPDFKTPGKVNGKPVKVYYQLPIKFRYDK